MSTICLKNLKSELVGAVYKKKLTSMQLQSAIKKIDSSIYEMFMHTTIDGQKSIEVKPEVNNYNNIEIMNLNEIKYEFGNGQYINDVYKSNSNLVNTLRVFSGKNKDKHFGNPFESNYNKNVKDPVGNNKEVSEMYKNWIIGNNIKVASSELQKKIDSIVKDNEPRRDWIINEILSGNLDDKKLVYYNDTNINHSKVLSNLISNKELLSREPGISPIVIDENIEDIDTNETNQEDNKEEVEDTPISGSGPQRWRTDGEILIHNFGVNNIGDFLNTLIGYTGDMRQRTNNEAYHANLQKMIDIINNTMRDKLFMKNIEIVLQTTNDNFSSATYEAWDGERGVVQTDTGIDVKYVNDAGRMTIRYGKDFDNTKVNPNGSIIDYYDNSFSGFRELVVHEMLHAMIDEAIAADKNLLNSVSAVQKQFGKHITSENMESVLKEISGGYEATVAQKNQIKDITEYVNSSPVEFLMYSMTNPVVFEILDRVGGTEEQRIELVDTSGRELRDRREGTPSKFRALMDKFIDIINNIYSMVKVGKVIKNGKVSSQTALDILQNIVAQGVIKTASFSANANRDAEYTGGTYGDYNQVLGTNFNLTDKYKEYDEKLKNLGKKGFDKLSKGGERFQVGKKVEEVASWFNRFEIIKDSNEKGRFRLFSDVINTIVEDTTNIENGAADFYKMYRDIKGSRDHDKIAMLQAAREKFDVLWLDVDKSERSSITNILMADYRSIGDLDTVARLLDDSLELDFEIEILKSEINVVEYNENAKFLGYYMMHGESKAPELMRNATMIVERTYGIGNRALLVNPNRKESVTKSVDKLATLYALKYMNKEDKDNVLKTLQNHRELVEATSVAYYKNVDSQTKRFSAVGLDKYILKGSVKMSSEVDMKFEVLPEKEIRTSKSFSHTKVRINEEATRAINDGQTYWTVVSRDYGVSRTQGGFDDIHIIDKGMGIRNVMFGDTKLENTTEFQRFAEEHNKNSSETLNTATSDDIDSLIAMDNNLVPSYNVYGYIVDYEIPIANAHRLNQSFGRGNNDIAEVIAQTISHINSKENAIKNNAKFAQMLVRESEENAGEKGYVLLRPSSLQELQAGTKHKYEEEWAMIPSYIQNMILNKDENGKPRREGLWVKEGRINNIIGYKDASIVNIKLFSKNPMFSDRPDVKRALEVLEYYWKQIAGRYKEIVVKYFPNVIWANMSSNMFVAMRHGVGPMEYAKAFTRHWSHLTDYLELSEQLINLKIDKDSGKDTSAQIKALEKQMKANPFSRLIEDGQFGTIMEDLDKSGLTKKSHTEDFIDAGFAKAQKFTGRTRELKEIGSNLFIARNSSTHKVIEKLTVYNDIINKSIIMERMMQDLNTVEFVNKSDKEAKIQDVLNYLDQLFVNYSYLDNKYIKYANDVSILMFTKYFFRALKANVNMMTRYPLASLGFEGIDLGVIDVSDSFEQYLSPLDSFGNRLFPNPVDMVGDVFMPHTIGMMFR